MAADAERPQLREYRLQLGWTQQEMADRIAHLAWMERRERAGVNADMVAKWERGAKGISPRYRELLCRLFGVTADQLGLKNVPSAGTERGPAKVDDQSLVAMLDNVAGLLDQLGAAGTALAPHMLHVWKEAVTTRHTMLGLLDLSATDPIGHAHATMATVADLEQLAERYQALYDTADPAALLTSVTAHVRMAQDSLRQNLPADMRRRLLRNLAEVAILAGQLAADDLGNTMSGRAYYGLALDAAQQVADDPLTAIAHGNAAQVAAAEGFTMAALDHLTAGNEHVHSTPAIACWLATIKATIHADRGEHTLAQDALDRAHTILDQAVGWATPVSCPHPGTPHLNAATGHVLSLAGAYTEACKKLLAALDQSHSIPRRQRILVLIDLATAELHSGDFSAACSHATQAAEQLHHAAYAVGVARLRAFRTVAQRSLNNRALRALDEHLTRFAA